MRQSLFQTIVDPWRANLKFDGSLKICFRCDNNQPEVGCKSWEKTYDETPGPLKGGRVPNRKRAIQSIYMVYPVLAYF
jgi:hypothetical protein